MWDGGKWGMDGRPVEVVELGGLGKEVRWSVWTCL